VIAYRATLDVPPDLVSWIENLVAARRSERGGSWYALTSFDQAVMTLVWLTKDTTYEQLAADFGVAVATAHEYVNDTIDQLARFAPTLAEAIAASGPERRLLLDGTLIPTWRCAALATETNADPLYNGKHHEHGMVVQALADTDGELVFLGEARPGCTHDLAEARADGIINAMTEAGVETIADSGYQGAGGTVRTPVKRPKGKGHNGFEKRANAAHARLRVPVERGFAVLKRFHILDRLRISPGRATTLLHAILAIIQKRSSLAKA
jgi:hypothetical protein